MSCVFIFDWLIDRNIFNFHHDFIGYRVRRKRSHAASRSELHFVSPCLSTTVSAPHISLGFTAFFVLVSSAFNGVGEVMCFCSFFQRFWKPEDCLRSFSVDSAPECIILMKELQPQLPPVGSFQFWKVSVTRSCPMDNGHIQIDPPIGFEIWPSDFEENKVSCLLVSCHGPDLSCSLLRHYTISKIT